MCMYMYNEFRPCSGAASPQISRLILGGFRPQTPRCGLPPARPGGKSRRAPPLRPPIEGPDGLVRLLGDSSFYESAPRCDVAAKQHLDLVAFRCRAVVLGHFLGQSAPGRPQKSLPPRRSQDQTRRNVARQRAKSEKRNRDKSCGVEGALQIASSMFRKACYLLASRERARCCLDEVVMCRFLREGCFEDVGQELASQMLNITCLKIFRKAGS